MSDRAHSEAVGLSIPAGETAGGAANHTPGPWAWGPNFSPGDCTGDLFGLGGRQVIASASYENMWLAAYDKEIDAANARLIAAAPDLLEALRQSATGWLNALELGIIPPQHRTAAIVMRDEAFAAIAKATPSNETNHTEGAGR